MPLLQPSWRGRTICDQSRAGTAGHSPILGPLTTDDPLPMFTNLPEEVAWHQPSLLRFGKRYDKRKMPNCGPILTLPRYVARRNCGMQRQ